MSEEACGFNSRRFLLNQFSYRNRFFQNWWRGIGLWVRQNAHSWHVARWRLVWLKYVTLGNRRVATARQAMDDRCSHHHQSNIISKENLHKRRNARSESATLSVVALPPSYPRFTTVVNGPPTGVSYKDLLARKKTPSGKPFDQFIHRTSSWVQPNSSKIREPTSMSRPSLPHPTNFQSPDGLPRRKKSWKGLPFDHPSRKISDPHYKKGMARILAIQKGNSPPHPKKKTQKLASSILTQL